MEDLIKFVMLVLVATVALIIRGFVALKLWAWFVVPIFEVQPLRLIEAVALIFLVSYATERPGKQIKTYEYWDEFTHQFIYVLYSAIFTLIAGWVVSLFI